MPSAIAGATLELIANSTSSIVALALAGAVADTVSEVLAVAVYPLKIPGVTRRQTLKRGHPSPAPPYQVRERNYRFGS